MTIERVITGMIARRGKMVKLTHTTASNYNPVTGKTAPSVLVADEKALISGVKINEVNGTSVLATDMWARFGPLPFTPVPNDSLLLDGKQYNVCHNVPTWDGDVAISHKLLIRK